MPQCISDADMEIDGGNGTWVIVILITTSLAKYRVIGTMVCCRAWYIWYGNMLHTTIYGWYGWMDGWYDTEHTKCSLAASAEYVPAHLLDEVENTQLSG